MAYDTSKLTKLAALKALAQKVESDYATKTSVSNLEQRINEIVATGGEPNNCHGCRSHGDAERSVQCYDLIFCAESAGVRFLAPATRFNRKKTARWKTCRLKNLRW